MSDRRRGLGASDAAAACGLSPWASPLELWMAKTGRAVAQEETLPMRVGKALEPVVLAAFEARNGQSVTNRQQKITDPRLPWRWATIDGMTDDALVEAKTAGSLEGWGEDGSDQIPLHYVLQCQHALACATDFDSVWVPVLFAAREFRCYRVQRDDALIVALTEKEAAFWGLVEADTPPEAVTSADVRLRWPTDTGLSVVATDDILAALTELHKVRGERKVAEALEDALQAQIQRFMADAATLLGPDGRPVATWKTATSRRLDAKALDAAHPEITRQFRVESTARRFLLK